MFIKKKTAKKNPAGLTLSDAVNLIATNCPSRGGGLAANPGLMPVITHWLQNPIESPIGLNGKVRSKWKKLLVEWYTQSNANIGKTKRDEIILNELIDCLMSDVPFPPPTRPKFTFIDLFAGIGGFRIALQELGGRCVFSSEWNKAARLTYFNNFGEVPFGDIHEFTATEVTDHQIDQTIPDHQILAAGFPCQPFSRAGVSARTSLGQKHGFSCDIQGTLFFDIVRIVKAKKNKPDALLLENVKNLERHERGETIRIIEKTIREDLGYSFDKMVIDSSPIVPQKRERCFIVCFKKGTKFNFPVLAGKPLPLSSALEKNVPDKYTISDRLWAGHKNRTRRNLERGVGFTAYEADLSKPAHTLVARYGKDGKECLIPQKGKNPRKLTPRECARLQGFPETYVLPSSDAASYKQFGNSVPVPVVKEVARQMLKALRK